MEPIKTQTIWTAISPEGIGWGLEKYIGGWMEKKSDMVVMSVPQLIEIIENSRPGTDHTTYINNLLKINYYDFRTSKKTNS